MMLSKVRERSFSFVWPPKGHETKLIPAENVCHKPQIERWLLSLSGPLAARRTRRVHCPRASLRRSEPDLSAYVGRVSRGALREKERAGDK